MKMKSSVLFVCSLLVIVAASAMAAADPNSCATKSKQLKRSERQAFIKSCMEQVSSPTNVKEVEQQKKRAQCDQNAKNQHLDGNAKGSYVNECMNKNEAAEVASAQPEPVAAAKPAKAKPAAAKVAAKGNPAQRQKAAPQKHKPAKRKAENN